MSSNEPVTAEGAWRTTAVVLSALPVGVTMFAAITAWLRSGQPGSDVSALLTAWMALALVEMVAGVVIWKRAVAPYVPASGFASSPDMTALAQLQTGLIVCMALAEGLGLFGVLIYFLGGPFWVALASVVIAWAALMVVWPRRAWYGLR